MRKFDYIAMTTLKYKCKETNTDILFIRAIMGKQSGKNMNVVSTANNRHCLWFFQKENK